MRWAVNVDLSHVTPGLRNLVDDDFTFTGAALVVLVYGSLSHHFMAGLLERVVAAERRGHHRPGLRDVPRDLPWRRLIVAVAVCAFAVPEVAIGSIASVTHHLTHNPTIGAIGHAIPAIVLLPIARCPSSSWPSTSSTWTTTRRDRAAEATAAGAVTARVTASAA